MSVVALICAPSAVSALDLTVVTLFQVDIQERFERSDLAGQSGAGDPIRGPAGYYYYDDCFAQFGIEGETDDGDVDFVIDFARTAVTRDGDALVLSGGLTATRGETPVDIDALTVRAPGEADRGDLHYLFARLGRHCRTGE